MASDGARSGLLEGCASFSPPTASPQTNFISIANFAAVYSAAEFSLVNGYPLASHLIINWTTLGINSDDDVAKAFLAFTKRLRDYLTRRGVPPLWFYAHERGPSTGAHTHVAIFLPVDVAELRADFMEWLRTWPVRQFGRRVPRAIRMRVAKAHDPRLHWLLFNYIMKTYDPAAVVQSAKHAAGGQTIMLGDLITFPRRDPGITTTGKRIGFSQSLGPAEQAKGLPAAWTGRRKVGATFRLVAGSPPLTLPPPPVAGFRSTFEDACYDVRQLYGREFAEWLGSASMTNTGASSAQDAALIEQMIGEYI